MVKVFEKKRAKHLAYSRRFMSKTSNDAVKLKKLQKMMIIISLKLKGMPIDSPERENHVRLFQLVVKKYLQTSVVIVDDEDLYCEPSRGRLIDSFRRAECRPNFRFAMHHLHALVELMQFPEEVILSNGKTIEYRLANQIS